MKFLDNVKVFKENRKTRTCGQMKNKGLVSVLMIVIAILLAVVGYVFAYSPIFSGPNIDRNFLSMIGIGCWVGGFIIGLMGSILGMAVFIKWAITE